MYFSSDSHGVAHALNYRKALLGNSEPGTTATRNGVCGATVCELRLRRPLPVRPIGLTGLCLWGAEEYAEGYVCEALKRR
jgi:hypothetical protein